MGKSKAFSQPLQLDPCNKFHATFQFNIFMAISSQEDWKHKWCKQEHYQDNVVTICFSGMFETYVQNFRSYRLRVNSRYLQLRSNTKRSQLLPLASKALLFTQLNRMCMITPKKENLFNLTYKLLGYKS